MNKNLLLLSTEVNFKWLVSAVDDGSDLPSYNGYDVEMMLMGGEL